MSSKLLTWLKNLRVSRVALVDKPANPEAEVVLFKAKTPPNPPPSSTDGTCPYCGNVMKDGACSCQKADPGVSDVSSPTMTGAQGKPKGIKRPAPGTDEHDAYKHEGAMPEPEKTKTKDEVVELLEKAEMTELRKALEKEQAEKRLLADRIEKIELARRNEVYVAKAAEFDYLPGAKPDDLGPILSKVDAALDDTQRQTFWTYLRSANQAIKHSTLFGERGIEGIGGANASEPEQALQKIAKAKMESDPKLTYDEAYFKAATENPKLYEKYEADRRTNGRK